jgi:NAD+ kinase
MMTGRKPPTRFAVASYPQNPEALSLAARIAGHLQVRGVEAWHGLLYDEGLRRKVAERSVDMLVALGGDGTMLRAGQLCAAHTVPILGINVGHFGFLIEVDRSDWQPALERALSGDYWLEQRMMLRVELQRKEEVLGAWDVLNECVVGRGDTVRPVRLTAEVDGRAVTTYVADALIVATPTGSTAYALATGGPILPPELRNILIIPVAPHLSVDRAIVLHEGSRVRVTVHTDHQASLSADGQPSIRLEDGDQVDVRASAHTATFVRFRDAGYFYASLLSRMSHNPTVGEP